ncbi:MAG: efflux RND transporter permease subunit [bacterium]
MIAWFAKNDVAANLLLFTLLFLGLVSLQKNIPLEVFPSIARDAVNVSVALRGATPPEIESTVTSRIEEALQDLEGIEKITSKAVEGATNINIEIDSNYDSRDLLADIKSRVDAINGLPVELEKPIINLVQPKREVITVALSGKVSEKEIRQLAERVRDDLLQKKGITQVQLDAVRPYEISISISQQTLDRYQISFQEVANALRQRSIDLSAGSLKTRGGEILLRNQSRAIDVEALLSIPVRETKKGNILYLKDIAKVKNGFEEEPLKSRFNGMNAAFVDVFRVGDQSAIDVADKVKAYIVEQQQKLPENVDIGYWRDRSNIVKKRLATLTNNAIQGGILVLALLALFLRPAIAFWVFIGVPVSFMGAFLMMPVFDVTLNVFSLFAFILVLGVVVDDAIVTGENVYRHMNSSESSLEAAIRGTQEVALPVTFGVLTTVVAFIPMAFIDGIRGKLFAQIPVVVIPILIFSLIESKFVLPSHLKHIRRLDLSQPLSGFSAFQRRFSNGFEGFVERVYQPLLSRCLNYRYTFLASLFGLLLIIIALATSGWTRFVFFPRIQSEVARVTLTMPTGTPFEVTDKFVQRITNAALKLKEKHIDADSGESIIVDIFSTTGSGGGVGSVSNKGRVMFEITPPESRHSNIGTRELVKEWRKLIGPLPGIESWVFRAEIGRASDPIDIQLTGRNLDELSSLGDQIKEKLKGYPGVFDISDSLSKGKQEFQVELLPSARSYGLSESDIINQIRAAMFGLQVDRIQRGREDVRVMLRLSKQQRTSLPDLLDLKIKTAQNQSIPLQELVRLKTDRSPVTITRIDGYRVLQVTADIDKKTVNMTLVNKEIKAYIQNLLSQYPGVNFSLEGEAKEQAESFSSLIIGLAFVLFSIYALLAIPFKSYTQPFIVMFVIPFGLMGSVVGHWIIGTDLTLLSLLGMLALIGVVVNDSLVLVDFINTKRKTMDIHQAILMAGVARFRPVILTSVTTFFGLMPLLFEKSTQAQFLKPMAISLGFGILFATVVTLLLVPINYQILEDMKGAEDGNSENKIENRKGQQDQDV